MLDDSEVIRRVQEGDPAAFDILVNRYRVEVYRMALRRVRRPQDAEEVTQNAFIKAYTNLDHLRDCTGFGPWLRVIAAHESISYLRSRKRADQVEPEEAVNPCPDPSPGPEQTLMEMERRNAIRQAISSLPEHERRVAHAFYVEGRSYREIQDSSGLARSSIAGYLYRARQRLSLRLEGVLSLAWLPGWETWGQTLANLLSNSGPTTHVAKAAVATAAVATVAVVSHIVPSPPLPSVKKVRPPSVHAGQTPKPIRAASVFGPVPEPAWGEASATPAVYTSELPPEPNTVRLDERTYTFQEGSLTRRYVTQGDRILMEENGRRRPATLEESNRFHHLLAQRQTPEEDRARDEADDDNRDIGEDFDPGRAADIAARAMDRAMRDMDDSDGDSKGRRRDHDRDRKDFDRMMRDLSRNAESRARDLFHKQEALARDLSHQAESRARELSRIYRKQAEGRLFGNMNEDQAEKFSRQMESRAEEMSRRIEERTEAMSRRMEEQAEAMSRHFESFGEEQGRRAEAFGKFAEDRGKAIEQLHDAQEKLREQFEDAKGDPARQESLKAEQRKLDEKMKDLQRQLTDAQRKVNLKPFDDEAFRQQMDHFQREDLPKMMHQLDRDIAEMMRGFNRDSKNFNQNFNGNADRFDKDRSDADRNRARAERDRAKADRKRAKDARDRADDDRDRARAERKRTEKDRDGAKKDKAEKDKKDKSDDVKQKSDVKDDHEDDKDQTDDRNDSSDSDDG